MQLVETKISAISVRMRYADNPDPDRATEWIEFVVKLSGLKHPGSHADLPLGNPEEQFLAEVQLAALRHARDVIGGETQRLSELGGRIR